MVTAIADARVERIGGVEASRFQWQVLAVSAGPWLGAILLHQLTTVLLLGAFAVLRSLLGTHHVGSTVALYADPQMRRLMRANPVRFYLAPVAAIVGTAVLFAMLPVRACQVAVVVFAIWSTHHFSRQNFGLFAFTCRARREAGPTSVERQVIRWTTVVGVLGAIRHGAPWLPLEPIAEPARVLGLMLAFGLLVVVATQARTSTRARTIGLAMTVLFYLPAFVYPPSLIVAGAAYGMAHAAQYYLMMTHLRRGRTRVGSAGFVLALGVAVMVAGTTLAVASTMNLAVDWRFAIGAYEGAVLAHFIIDAGVWKLSNPAHRAFMQERFAFL